MGQVSGTSGQEAEAFIANGQPFRNQDGPDPMRSGVWQAALNAGQTAYSDSPRYESVRLQPAAAAGGKLQ